MTKYLLLFSVLINATVLAQEEVQPVPKRGLAYGYHSPEDLDFLRSL